MSDGGFDFGKTFCQNPDCDERIPKSGDGIFQIQPPRDQFHATGLFDVYCSARCVARGMAAYDGVDRVNVYDAATEAVTPGGVVDDD
jgi:hypothetical protein